MFRHFGENRKTDRLGDGGTKKLEPPGFPGRVRLLQHDQMEAQARVVDAEISSERIPNDGFGVNQRNLLRHDADIDGVAPEIPVAVNPQSVATASNQRDIALEPLV